MEIFIILLSVYFLILGQYLDKLKATEIYDERGNLIYWCGAGKRAYWKSMVYDDLGRLVTFIDSTGCDVTYTY